MINISIHINIYQIYKFFIASVIKFFYKCCNKFQINIWNNFLYNITKKIFIVVQFFCVKNTFKLSIL